MPVNPPQPLFNPLNQPLMPFVTQPISTYYALHCILLLSSCEEMSDFTGTKLETQMQGWQNKKGNLFKITELQTLGLKCN